MRNTACPPRVQPPETPQFYPSLPWSGPAPPEAENIGRGTALVYVAMTRAGQRLILAGTTGKNSLEKNGRFRANATGARRKSWPAAIIWTGWFLAARRRGATALTASGRNALLNWTIYDENDPRLARRRRR